MGSSPAPGTTLQFVYYFDALMSCPGRSTSSEMCDEHMLAEGIGAGLVRMSIGFTDTIAQRWQQLSSALEIIL